jgi:hypothetical protein
MTYPDPHTPPDRQTQASRVFDRPMMSGEPPFPERTGQAVDPKYATGNAYADPDRAHDDVSPKADLDTPEPEALTGVVRPGADPNPASLGGWSSPIMRWFDYEHLTNPRVRGVSRQFSELAGWVEQYLPTDPEKSTALRKLLEGKDAAVRAAILAEETGQ